MSNWSTPILSSLTLRINGNRGLHHVDCFFAFSICEIEWICYDIPFSSRRFDGRYRYVIKEVEKLWRTYSRLACEVSVSVTCHNHCDICHAIVSVKIIALLFCFLMLFLVYSLLNLFIGMTFYIIDRFFLRFFHRNLS